MVYVRNFNQLNGNLEEYTTLLMAINEQMQEIQALSMSIPEVDAGELVTRFSIIIEKLEALIGTSAIAKETMEAVLRRFLDLYGDGL